MIDNNILDTSLPQKILSGPNLDNKDEQTDHITAILKGTLPPRERNTIIQELNWHFTLEKQAAEKCKNILKKQKRRKRIKKQPLHGIEKPTTGWCYQELIPVRDMWREYIKRCIGGPVKEENNSLRVILGKCEFIGGDVTVEKALSAGCVGMNGIVIKETQKMFGIVNKNSKYQGMYFSIIFVLN